jgi:formate dehydrogenase subunit delta
MEKQMEMRDMVRMANQIADFFKTYGDDDAKREIANHINSFWEPRMRQDLFKYLDGGGKDINPLVVAASGAVRRPRQHPDAEFHPESTGG